MPIDKEGDFWRPTCGVKRCFYRRCFMYSNLYGKCLLLVLWAADDQAEEPMTSTTSRKASTLATIANINRSLQQKPASKGNLAKAHAEQAKPVKLESILNYDE